MIIDYTTGTAIRDFLFQAISCGDEHSSSFVPYLGLDKNYRTIILTFLPDFPFFAQPYGIIAYIISSQIFYCNNIDLCRRGVIVIQKHFFEKSIFYGGEAGVLVSGVDPGSPADAAGMKVGQLLLSVNGKPVRGIHHEDIPGINQLLSELPVGERAVFSLRTAEGAVDDVGVAPLEKGRVEGDDFDCRRWNMTIKAINEFATPLLHFFKSEGAYVQAVKHPGNAAAAGLRQGDIIVEIDGVPVDSLDRCREMYEVIVADEAREKKVVFTVLRGGLRNYQVLDYSPRYGQD